MSDTTPQLSLDSDVSECGDRFTGSVQWHPLDDDPVAARVELRYCTQGRGDPDGAVVSLVELDGAAGGSGRFELSVPASGPMSFDGALILVKWSIDLVIDTAMQPDADTSVPVTVLPRGGVALWARQQASPPPET
jgi:hypothetical protein